MLPNCAAASWRGEAVAAHDVCGNAAAGAAVAHELRDKRVEPGRDRLGSGRVEAFGAEGAGAGPGHPADGRSRYLPPHRLIGCFGSVLLRVIHALAWLFGCWWWGGQLNGDTESARRAWGDSEGPVVCLSDAFDDCEAKADACMLVA
jgi:hypothetical protein